MIFDDENKVDSKRWIARRRKSKVQWSFESKLEINAMYAHT